MIAVIGERGPLSAADLAQAITERGRYAPPRSGKPLDAAMISQRVSNPTYRARFRRSRAASASPIGVTVGPGRPLVGGQPSRMKVTRMLAWNSTAPS